MSGNPSSSGKPMTLDTSLKKFYASIYFNLEDIQDEYSEAIRNFVEVATESFSCNCKSSSWISQNNIVLLLNKQHLLIQRVLGKIESEFGKIKKEIIHKQILEKINDKLLLKLDRYKSSIATLNEKLISHNGCDVTMNSANLYLPIDDLDGTLLELTIQRVEALKARLFANKSNFGVESTALEDEKTKKLINANPLKNSNTNLSPRTGSRLLKDITSKLPRCSSTIEEKKWEQSRDKKQMARDNSKLSLNSVNIKEKNNEVGPKLPSRNKTPKDKFSSSNTTLVQSSIDVSKISSSVNPKLKIYTRELNKKVEIKQDCLAFNNRTSNKTSRNTSELIQLNPSITRRKSNCSSKRSMLNLSNSFENIKNFKTKQGLEKSINSKRNSVANMGKLSNAALKSDNNSKSKKKDQTGDSAKSKFNASRRNSSNSELITKALKVKEKLNIKSDIKSTFQSEHSKSPSKNPQVSQSNNNTTTKAGDSSPKLTDKISDSKINFKSILNPARNSFIDVGKKEDELKKNIIEMMEDDLLRNVDLSISPTNKASLDLGRDEFKFGQYSHDQDIKELSSNNKNLVVDNANSSLNFDNIEAEAISESKHKIKCSPGVYVKSRVSNSLNAKLQHGIKKGKLGDKRCSSPASEIDLRKPIEEYFKGFSPLQLSKAEISSTSAEENRPDKVCICNPLPQSDITIKQFQDESSGNSANTKFQEIESKQDPNEKSGAILKAEEILNRAYNKLKCNKYLQKEGTSLMREAEEKRVVMSTNYNALEDSHKLFLGSKSNVDYINFYQSKLKEITKN